MISRRKFFKLFATGTVAAIVAPRLLIPKEPKFNTCNGINITLAHNPILDDPKVLLLKLKQGSTIWIHKDEWCHYKTHFEIAEERLRRYLYDKTAK